MTTTRLPLIRTTALAAAIVLLAGCETTPTGRPLGEREKGTATGAAIGAVAGAVIGSASGDAGKGALIGAAAGAVAGNLWSKSMEDKRREMERATAGTGAQVTRTADNQLKLEVPADISFATGSATIEPRLRSVLDAFANGLSNQPTMYVRIVGHTDSTGSDAVNDPLSLRRANSVRDYLTDRGVAASRIETFGRGSREPIASNDTPEGRAKNRRVEIFLRDTAKG
ncbi:OmpA family protein [Azohydromonas sediminis]|uniref:OmpA family protein n=1 Tax=Azohydromonas sediminis TaxID=2259674 RepID=UPI000E65B0DE|nr:OmpA family protein [Azohydromonas sediminis]